MYMVSKQTAVEWLIEQLNKKIDLTQLSNWTEIESLIWAAQQKEIDLFIDKYNSIVDAYNNQKNALK